MGSHLTQLVLLPESYQALNVTQIFLGKLVREFVLLVHPLIVINSIVHFMQFLPEIPQLFSHLTLVLNLLLAVGAAEVFQELLELFEIVRPVII